MTDKIRVGIFFGGRSREREVSFAGGRTVYDNLDKSIFEAIPLFVDSFNNIVLLDWEYIYKGSIRDFYPPVSFLPDSANHFQVYAESVTEDLQIANEMAAQIGKVVSFEELKRLIDVAFLALHGPMGEDGTLQGALEWLQIPYTGSGVFGSAAGISKSKQKAILAETASFQTQSFSVLSRSEWQRKDFDRKRLFEVVGNYYQFPLVIKSSVQGSSIGVTILSENEFSAFEKAVDKSFFTERVVADFWNSLSLADKVAKIKQTVDFREGIGMPVLVDGQLITHPESLMDLLNNKLTTQDAVFVEASQAEHEVVFEKFIKGREFSCIVIEDDNGKVIALPPTEIKKGTDLFDYKSKYLPGLSRKITPIDVNKEVLNNIRTECQKLFSFFGFDVYARIDGFLSEEGKIYLNDPNTTSGMMPSSFFFHQAAEIGLNPSQFLTFIIRNSLRARANSMAYPQKATKLLSTLDLSIGQMANDKKVKERVAVIMGGYSFERHISVESGRNIYEKLSSSEKYDVIPVFLAGSPDNMELFVLPVNIMLKDNADDIKEKVRNYKDNEVLSAIRQECASITTKYVSYGAIEKPRLISFQELASLADGVFIALHGRPGEDGTIQKELDKVGLYYNGSGTESSSVTINKFETNNKLREAGFLVADNMLVTQKDWEQNKEAVVAEVREKIGFPLIAKPHDDGCSSAVKKIKSVADLEAYAAMIFRKSDDFVDWAAAVLQLQPKEEFSRKDCFLLEHFVQKDDAYHFLEVTGGMLTRYNSSGEPYFEMFEPSESLAESEILSLEEKFLAGQGQNITPARYSKDPETNKVISKKVREELERAARFLGIEGYARIDVFVKIYPNNEVKVYFIEVNSLPGMTPATCIYHQAAINQYKPYDFIDNILTFGKQRNMLKGIVKA